MLEEFRTATARRLVNDVNRAHGRYHDYKRRMEQSAAEETEARVKLAKELKKLLKAHPEAIEDGWIAHWCINGGDEQLARLAWEHERAKQVAAAGIAA